jgi:chromate transporter
MAPVTRPRPSTPDGRLREVTLLFLRLGVTAFGGPAAHVALMERECVRKRGWLTPQEFVDLLGVANLIPGPTSTELAMHIGRRRAGWPGLVTAGLAFMVPAAVLVGLLAALYVRAGDLPVLRGVLAAVQPVVLVVVLDALIPLARTAISSAPTVVIALATTVFTLAGLPEFTALLLGGVMHLFARRTAIVLAAVGTFASVGAAAISTPLVVRQADVFMYFARVGSLLFGSGYVLLSVLEGDLVQRRGWLTNQQLFDAIAAGQATPGPVFTTATFIGYLLGGPWMALVATIGIFLPAFVFAACSSAMLDRLRRLESARSFLKGVNAAAVALIALVLVTLAQAALTGLFPMALAIIAAGLIVVMKINPSFVLMAAAILGGVVSLVRMT